MRYTGVGHVVYVREPTSLFGSREDQLSLALSRLAPFESIAMTDRRVVRGAPKELRNLESEKPDRVEIFLFDHEGAEPQTLREASIAGLKSG